MSKAFELDKQLCSIRTLLFELLIADFAFYNHDLYTDRHAKERLCIKRHVPATSY